MGTPEAGRYKAVLTSDDVEFGGQGRINHETEHFTHPEGTPGHSPSFPQASKVCDTGLGMRFADMSAPDKVRLESTLTCACFAGVAETNFNNRAFSMLVAAPSRIVVVYAKMPEEESVK